MMSPRIFISYSRRDKAVADYIGAELRNRGADVFIDYQKLIGGENFIGRLGREIEACNFFVLLLSPRSVASKWVQAEAAWALHCDKPIIPVLLEPASMADFFFLTNVEYVDFARWSVDGEVGEAVRKLAAALGLSAEPIHAEPVPEPLVQAAPSEEEEAEDKLEATSAPAFARGDLSELFLTAAEVAHQDPEQAIFLYRRVIEIDPEYMQGRARDFLQREEERLKPARLARMLAQAETAMEAGEWSRAERVGRDMLELDEDNADAKRIISLYIKNAECEPMYKQAIIAAQRGRWRAVEILMSHIKESCPDHGDPAGLFSGRPIKAGLIGYVRALATLAGHYQPVLSVAFSPDGSLLASASSDKVIKLWETVSRRELARLTGHDQSVRSVAFSPDGSLLASASGDTTIKQWKMPSGHELYSFRGHFLDSSYRAVLSVVFSPDGSLLASSGEHGSLRLWETAIWGTGSRREPAMLSGHGGTVYSVAFSPDGSLLASAAADGTIKIWETTGGRELATLTGHRGAVRSVAFSPDGSLLASAAADETIKTWETPGGRELATLRGYGVVYSVAFSPDGSLLASSEEHGTLRLWEMPGGRPLATLRGHSGAVYSVTFSPDGSLLASGSDDKTVKLWGLG